MSLVLTALRKPQWRHRIWWPLFALFCARAIVPVGYMPAALAEGGPFALCHGLSAATLDLIGQRDAAAAGMPQAGHAHGDTAPHGTPSDGHHDRWEHCPLGVGATDLAVAPVLDFVTAPRAATLARAAGLASSPTRHFSRYSARAPPV